MKKRIISMLLVIATIISMLPGTMTAYAEETGGHGTGTEDEVGGTSSGTYTEDKSGYRMYLINLDGKRVSNVVDILMKAPPTSGTLAFNTRFESFSTTASEGYQVRQSSQLLGVSSPLEAPIGHSGSFYSKGDDFREWMLAGKEMPVTESFTGNVNYNYNPKSNSGSNSSSGTPSDEVDTATLQDYVEEMNSTAWTTLQGLHTYGYLYTRDQAIGLAMTKVTSIVTSVDKDVPGAYMISAALSNAARSIYYDMVANASKDGWKDSVTSEGTGGRTGSELREDGVIEAPNTSRLFDIAYATNSATGAGTEDQNLIPLLNGNNLFTEQYLDKSLTLIRQSTGDVDIVSTMASNQLYLMVETIHWFTPSKQRDSGRVDKDGDPIWEAYDSYGQYWYGTPVNYGQWYQKQKASGGWTDGGWGGWYGRAHNKTSAQALFIPEAMTKTYGKPGEGEPIIGAFKAGTGKEEKYSNDQLANWALKHGYAMHFYWAGGGADFPEIPTYDTTKVDPNPDPHVIQDPDDPTKDTTTPGTIPVLSKEMPEPGTPLLRVPEGEEPEERGYKNTTRTITVVKTYTKEVLCSADDPECIDTNELRQPYKWEHVETFAKANCPGTIHIMHEENYRVVEWFTTESTVTNSWDWSLVDADPDNFLTSGIFGPVSETPWKSAVDDGWNINAGIDDRIPESNRTFHEEYEWADVEGKDKAGTPAKTVKLGLAVDPDYDPNSGEQPEKGYYDTTLYVHLLLKPGVPETHTLDDPTPDDPDNDDPKSPGPAPDPLAPYEDPSMDEEEKKQLVHKIVKVYETKTLHADGTTTTNLDGVFVRSDTAGIIKIEDESHLPEEYNLQDWLWSTDMDYSGANWEEIKGSVSPVLGSGDGPETVDIRNPEDIYEPRTLYVYLNREKVEGRKPGDIDIEQSQISKAIHTNDATIGMKPWGDYEFKLIIGPFLESHGYKVNHCCKSGSCKYHSCGCVGHICDLGMPGRKNGDDEVTFIFEQIGDTHALQIEDGVHNSLTRKVYSKVSQFEKIKGMEETKWQYSSNGNEDKGEELVTVLWRGTSLLKDVPTLAKYKQTDIVNTYGSSNWEIPQAMLKNESNKSKVTRKPANDDYVFDLAIEFGINKSKSEIRGVATCNKWEYAHGRYADTQYVKTYGGTDWTYNFTAKVVIRVYKGLSKALAAQPFGGVVTNRFKTVSTGNHFSNNLIQGIQQIKFFPYIKMTYMTNSLKLAELEEQNQEVYTAASRYETYVLSEYESSILPSDSVEVGWQNNEEEESILLTSQQWSLHQRAINGGEAWNGTNQVLPGGAIYQLSTPNDRISNVKIITYQTVVDDKTRQYLSVPLTGDEYTVEKVASDHEDFVNDAKEVIDNLRIVQWVSKDYDSTYAWPSNWTETNGDGKVCIRGGGESLTELGLTLETNTEDKYYMKAAGAPTDYQSAKLKDITYTVADGSKEKANEGDLDIMKISQVTTVFKVFTDTAGNVYLASMKQTGTDNVEAQIKSMVNAMKDLNADTRSKYSGSVTIQRLCDRKTSGAAINAILTGDAKQIDDRTSFITNAVLCLNRNQGYDKTAAWATTDGKWYNEAFDGMYLVRQAVTIETGLQYSTSRASALDPALCPSNVGQSDLYTNAFLSQFCLNDRSDAKIAEGKDERYLGTWREGTDQEMDILLPDMEGMYQSRKFYIPNANVQDLN